MRRTRSLRSLSAFRILAALASVATAGASAASALVGCSQPQGDGKPVAPGAADAQTGSAPAAQRPGAGGAEATADGGAPAAPQAYLGALFMQTPIMSDMEWPLPEGSRIHDPAREKVVRIGYIRKGGKVPVIPEAHKKPNCLDGWYELVAGGFVCGKYATLDLNHPVLRLNSPHAPDMNAPLPYQYGYNLTHGTPLYRAIPSREERLAYEPWLNAKARPKRGIEEDNPYAAVLLDAGTGAGASASAAGTGGGTANGSIALATTAPNVVVDNNASQPTSSTSDPLGIGLGGAGAGGEADGGTPWYLRDFDGGKPQITLDELRGDGPVVRRMVRGFYVALDKDETHNGVKWWKTIEGYVAPYDRIVVQRTLTDFHGVWLDAAPPNLPTAPGNPPTSDAGADAPVTVKIPTKLPIAFVLWNGHKYTMSDDHKKVTKGDTVSRFTAIGLTGESATIGGFTYHETEEGWWFRGADGRITKPGPVPKDLLPNEKWIDVNLTTQTLVAFVGEKPVYATLVSTGKGKKSDEKEKNHETRPGIFHIREKHIAATMDGDVASDGPYSIEDVPWIMYFNGSIALHGAFWHSNFGNVKSHGCVNLSPLDARAMFQWTDPPLPEGWHGVEATPEHPGTRVIVHDPPKDSIWNPDGTSKRPSVTQDQPSQ